MIENGQDKPHVAQALHGEFALDGVTYFRVEPAQLLEGLQIEFYSSPCPWAMYLVGRHGGIPSTSIYDIVLALERVNDKSRGGVCRATLIRGGLPGSAGAASYFFAVFGGYPLNSFFSFAGDRVPTFPFNLNVTTVRGLYDSVPRVTLDQTVTFNHPGPWNVVNGNRTDSVRLSYKPSLIASLPVDSQHTGGNLKYSATFLAAGEDGIDGIAICISWQRPSGLTNKCDVLQKSLVQSGSHVLSHVNEEGVWYVTAYALKMASGGAHHFPYYPVNQSWVYLEDAEVNRSQLLNSPEIDTTISDEAVAIDIWVENFTRCPEEFRMDPLNELQDQSCSLKVLPMLSNDPSRMNATGYHVLVENFVTVTDSSLYKSHDCFSRSGDTVCKTRSKSASWKTFVPDKVVGASAKMTLSLEQSSHESASKIGDFKILSATSSAIAATISIQCGGIAGDEDAITSLHSDDADTVLNAMNGKVTYTWHPILPRTYVKLGQIPLSLTLNISENDGNHSDDNSDPLLLSLDATPHLEFTWCSDEVCPIKRGTCRKRPTLSGVRNTYITTSNCKCYVGFGGEACSDRVVSSFGIFVWLILLCGSNFAGVPSVCLAMRLEPITKVLGVMLLCSMVGSTVYHMCDLQVLCVTRYSLLHTFDDVFVIFAFCALMFYLSCVPMPSSKHLLVAIILLLVCYVSAVKFGVLHDWIMAICITICSVFMIVTWCIEIYYLSTKSMGYRGALNKFFLSGDYLNPTKFSYGLFLTLIGAICFFLGDKVNYVLTHSIWHMCAMGSTYFFIQSRCWQNPERKPSQSGVNQELVGLKEFYSDGEDDSIDFASDTYSAESQH